MKPAVKKPSLKKIIWLSIACFMALLVVTFLVFIVWFNLQFKVYHDDQYKFSIKYPQSWKVVVHPRPNVAVIFIRPKDTIIDTVQENFNVTVQPLPEGIFTLEEFSDRVKSQMIGVFGPKVHFLEYRPMRWEWRQGYRLSIEARVPDNLRMVNAWLLNNNQAYILTFLGDINKYTHDALVVTHMIRSLKLQ